MGYIYNKQKKQWYHDANSDNKYSEDFDRYINHGNRIKNTDGSYVQLNSDGSITKLYDPKSGFNASVNISEADKKAMQSGLVSGTKRFQNGSRSNKGQVMWDVDTQTLNINPARTSKDAGNFIVNRRDGRSIIVNNNNGTAINQHTGELVNSPDLDGGNVLTRLWDGVTGTISGVADAGVALADTVQGNKSVPEGVLSVLGGLGRGIGSLAGGTIGNAIISLVPVSARDEVGTVMSGLNVGKLARTATSAVTAASTGDWDKFVNPWSTTNNGFVDYADEASAIGMDANMLQDMSDAIDGALIVTTGGTKGILNAGKAIKNVAKGLKSRGAVVVSDLKKVAGKNPGLTQAGQNLRHAVAGHDTKLAAAAQKAANRVDAAKVRFDDAAKARTANPLTTRQANTAVKDANQALIDARNVYRAEQAAYVNALRQPTIHPIAAGTPPLALPTPALAPPTAARAAVSNAISNYRKAAQSKAEVAALNTAQRNAKAAYTRATKAAQKAEAAHTASYLTPWQRVRVGGQAAGQMVGGYIKHGTVPVAKSVYTNVVAPGTKKVWTGVKSLPPVRTGAVIALTPPTQPAYFINENGQYIQTQ